MAFSFGAPAPATAGGFSFGGGGAAPAPAPATATSSSLFGGGGGGGGLFGAPAPAASTSSGGLFGSSNAAPAPAAGGGGLFGSTPAPSLGGGGLFGSSSAPAPAGGGGGLFGSTASAAPSTTGLFGSTPAPATGGLFGSTSAPATGGGLFSSAPAPATGGLFGAPAPAPASGGLFGTAPSMQQQQQQLQQEQHFSGNTPYAQLPEHAKRAIDQIYQLMMQHRRTLASVKTMAPALLREEDSGNLSPADAAAGSPARRPVPSTRASSLRKTTTDPSNEPLPQQMVSLQTQIQALLQSAESNLTEARQLKARAGEAVAQAKMHGAWPIENVAARRGVALSSIKGILNDYAIINAQTSASGISGGGTPASSLNLSGMANIDAIALQQIMDIRAARVDRIEPMPSPYLWEVLNNFEQRVAMAQRDVEAVRTRLMIAEESESAHTMGGTSMLLANAGGDLNVMASLMLNAAKGGAFEVDAAPLSTRLVALARSQNDSFLRIAAQAARAHEGLEEMKVRYQRYCQSTKGGYYQDPFLKADVEEFSREREMQQRIMLEQLATASPLTAATAAVVGTAASSAAPPASSAGLFGQPAPAPAMGGLFGSPAPAPSSTGGLFGAPAPGLFGSTATPAPAPSGGGLGLSTPAPSTGGSLFGGTPAPAPAAGGLFGSSTPATSEGLFGAAPTTPASTLAPRKKSATRSGGRRR